MREPVLAVALSGGAIRGAAHVGALKVLEKYGLKPDVLSGTSAGAMVGALYGSGVPVREIERVFLLYQDRSRFLDLNWGGILKSAFTLNLKHFRGLYLGKKLANLICRNLGYIRDFSDYARSDLPGGVRPVFLTAVNLADGQETVFAPPGTTAGGGYRICSRQSLAFAVHCSITIPGTFVPVACEPRPGCPCFGKGTQYYVDGGMRDMYPFRVPITLAGAGCVIGVNLGYAGMRESIWENGPAEYFGHVIDIMGHAQVEAGYQDYEVRRARVATVNPVIYDVGGFEAQYIPQLIARGEAVMEECLRRQGLRPGAGRQVNLAKLFPSGRRLLRYPAKGSAEFDYWLAHPIKGGGGAKAVSPLPDIQPRPRVKAGPAADAVTAGD